MNKKLIKAISAIGIATTILTSTAVTAFATPSGYYTSYQPFTIVEKDDNYTSMQGMAVDTDYFYTIKTNSSFNKSILCRTNRSTKETVVMTNSKTNSKYTSNLGHSNSVCVCKINGKTTLFVATIQSNSYSLVRLEVSGTKYSIVGHYSTIYSNETTAKLSAVDVFSQTKSDTTLLCKTGTAFLTVTIPNSTNSGKLKLKKWFDIDTSKVQINGKATDLSSYCHQSFGYYNGKIYVPLTSTNETNLSLIAVYTLSNISNGKLYSDSDLSVRISDSKYKKAFEIEDCGIGDDGRLYFNTNQAISKGNKKYDSINYVKDFQIKKYTVKYTPNCGTGTMSDTTVFYGDDTNLAKNTFSRNGYIFKGWYAKRQSDNTWAYANGTKYVWCKKALSLTAIH